MDQRATGSPDGPQPQRDLAVVGASAGGVEALTTLARGLPADLPMAILVVLHMPPTATSRLAEILNRAGPLPAQPASHGQVPGRGEIYVAPPDRHMVLSNGRIFLLDGPRENGVRPAIDPLFRSAAASAGDRATGIVLSGTLDDGAAGMAAIQAYGGATVVQDPDDALSDGMPRSVLELIQPDHVLPAAAMGDVLANLAAGTDTQVSAAGRTRDQKALVADPMTLSPSLTDLVCPDCGGSLAEVHAGPVTRFRCRVGHIYSSESLFGMKTGELEAGLWAALRSLEESTSIAKRLADRARRSGSQAMVRRFEERGADAAARADLVRQAIHTLADSAMPTPTEAIVPAAPGHDQGGRHEGTLHN
jgi:two-component system, chemotaxis family, protein-glutamate methylesterase/glutaminase